MINLLSAVLSESADCSSCAFIKLTNSFVSCEYPINIKLFKYCDNKPSSAFIFFIDLPFRLAWFFRKLVRASSNTGSSSSSTC